MAASVGPAGTSNDARPIIDRLTLHLREHGASYFDAAGPVVITDVRLIRGDRRSIAQLYWFTLEAHGLSRTVVVKVSGAVRAPSLRPRMAQPPDARTKYALEHRALSLIHEHFDQRDPERFGAIRVLDLLPEHQAFVMEAVDRPTLRELAMRSGWRGLLPGAADLVPVFRNAGAWLREFHGLDPTPARDEVLTDREEFLGFVGQITEYLTGRLDQRTYFSRVRRQVSTAARECLPARIPAGLAHNDYCIRNILVGPSQQVTVFDTPARLRTPIYRDLSFFLTDLSFSALPALVRGALGFPSRIGAYRSAFLDGYFVDSDLPERALRVFEIQALLERWCSAVASIPVSPRTRDRLRSRAVSAVFRSMVDRRL